MTRVLLTLLALIFFSQSHPVKGQSAKPAKPSQKTEGACSSIINDNHGTITLTCPGMSLKQFQQMANAIQNLGHLEASNLNTVIKKMQEVIEVVRSERPTIIQSAPGGVIQTGANSTGTVNNFGPIPMVITDEQLAAVTSAMRPFAGASLDIDWENASAATNLFVVRLRGALEAAGIAVGGIPAMLLDMGDGTRPQPGLTLFWKESDYTMLNSLGKALINSGFPPSYLTGFRSTKIEDTDSEGKARKSSIVVGQSF